ncbi:MAG: hypothetical protein QGH59_00375, partial [Gemmatimonadota bacterium]|nr:hypothetical protein [Gemmatimonadota bacterium]
LIGWSDGTDSGELNIGEDAGYDADDVIYVHDGMSVAFAAGTTVAAETFTVAVTAARRLRRDHTALTADLDPISVSVSSFKRRRMDNEVRTHDGRVERQTVATLRQLEASLDYLESAERDALLYIETARHPVTFAENYGSQTEFLWRGGTVTDDDGLLPVVGPYGTFARASTALREDVRTGLLTGVASGAPRYAAGKLGRAIALTEGRTSSTGRWLSDGSSHAFTTMNGTATLTFDTTVPPPLDPLDTTFSSGELSGTHRALWTDDAAPVDTVATAARTASASTDYTASVWLKGRGTIYLEIVDDIPTTANTLVTLTSEWVRHSVTHTTDASATTARVRLTAYTGADVSSVAWLGPVSLEEGSAATADVPSQGSAVTREAETLSFAQPIPASSGTLAF